VVRKALLKDVDKLYQRAYDFALDLSPVYGTVAAAAYGKHDLVVRLARVPE
jgi:hypothetical protein